MNDAGTDCRFRIVSQFGQITFSFYFGQSREELVNGLQPGLQARRDVSSDIFSLGCDKVKGDATASIDNQQGTAGEKRLGSDGCCQTVHA